LLAGSGKTGGTGHYLNSRIQFAGSVVHLSRANAATASMMPLAADQDCNYVVYEAIIEQVRR
jgi:hypothetical protein